METQVFELCDYIKYGEISEADRDKLKEAAKILSSGGLIAFPTETVYGLGGNALLKDASKNIYNAKGRPSDNPLIVHISSIEELPPLTDHIPEAALKLAESFWPGPLTMVMSKSDIIPLETTGGLDTVAVRMPVHPVARELIRLSGVPVSAPSANISGRPSPTTAKHCIEDLTGKIDAIVDGGASDIGVESTIVDVSGERPVLLRPGAVTTKMLKECLDEEIELDPALEKPLDKNIRPKAPGMKYRHYAPKAPMVIVQAEYELYSKENNKDTYGADFEDAQKDYYELIKKITDRVILYASEKCSEGCKVGIIGSDETMDCYLNEINSENGRLSLYKEQIELCSEGSRKNEISIAHNLFAVLRDMDSKNVDCIVAEGVDQREIGYAVMNRMKKAAGQHIIYV